MANTAEAPVSPGGLAGEGATRRSGSSHTAREVVLQWKGICYEVPVTHMKEDADGTKRKETASKTILQDQSGVVRPGDVLAILVRRRSPLCAV